MDEITSTGWLLVVAAGICLPGVAGTWLLFPSDSRGWRAALGIPLGVALLGFGMLLLDASPYGVSRTSTAALLLAENALAALALAVGWWRRRLTRVAATGGPRLDLVRVAAVVLASVAVVAAIPRWVASMEGHHEPFTAFSIVEATSADAPWLRRVPLEQPLQVHVAIRSHEDAPRAFSVVVTSGGATIQTIELGRVDPGERIVEQVSIPPRASSAQRVDIALYDAGASTPYRTLFFWVNA